MFLAFGLPAGAQTYVAMEDDFGGTQIDPALWVEHDSSAFVNQDDGLTVNGAGSWTNAGMESAIRIFRAERAHLVAEASVTQITGQSSPLGYGQWDPFPDAAAMVVFGDNGRLWTWLGSNAWDSGVSYEANVIYRFEMDVETNRIVVSAYRDTNGDGSFTEPAELTNLLAGVAGSVISDTMLEGGRLRMNAHSSRMFLNVKRVSVEKHTSNAMLLAALEEAQQLYDLSPEGDAVGEYPAAAKGALLTALELATAAAGAAGATQQDYDAAEATLRTAMRVFLRTQIGATIYHILSTGQSLSEGALGVPALSLTQPYSNLMISATGALVPLVATRNDIGEIAETMCMGLANTMTWHTPGQTLQTIVSRHGVSGWAYARIKKGTIPYMAGMAQVTNGMKAVAAMHRNYRVLGVTTMHGESDHIAGNGPVYESYLHEWQDDYKSDVHGINGQPEPVPLFLGQMSSCTAYGQATSLIPDAQLSAAENNPRIFLVGPKYFLDYADGIHLVNTSYRWIGEYYAKVIKRVQLDGEDWIPFSPRHITMEGSDIVACFYVPSPPIAIDMTNVLAQTNYGFEFVDGGSGAIITNVVVVDATTVKVQLDREPGASSRLRYAYTGVGGSWAGRNIPGSVRGNLRDSDAMPSLYGSALFNWLVHFDKPVPWSAPGFETEDLDTDGMPDAWEFRHFGSMDTSRGGAHEDWDNDGYTNEREWRAGTNPTNATSVLKIVTASPPSQEALAFTWVGVTDRLYRVECSTQLPPVTWAAVSGTLTALPPLLNTHTVDVSALPRAFYRVSTLP